MKFLTFNIVLIFLALFFLSCGGDNGGVTVIEETPEVITEPETFLHTIEAGKCIQVGEELWASKFWYFVNIYGNEHCSHRGPYKRVCKFLRANNFDSCWIGDSNFTVYEKDGDFILKEIRFDAS